MKKTIIALALTATTLTATAASAYTINGKYAQLISCDWKWSGTRGKSGYVGTYHVPAYNEWFTIWWGSTYCKH